MTGVRVYSARKSKKPYLIAGLFLALVLCATVALLVTRENSSAVASPQIPVAAENSQVDLTKATTQPQRVLILPKKKDASTSNSQKVIILPSEETRQRYQITLKSVQTRQADTGEGKIAVTLYGMFEDTMKDKSIVSMISEGRISSAIMDDGKSVQGVDRIGMPVRDYDKNFKDQFEATVVIPDVIGAPKFRRVYGTVSVLRVPEWQTLTWTKQAQDVGTVLRFNDYEFCLADYFSDGSRLLVDAICKFPNKPSEPAVWWGQLSSMMLVCADGKQIIAPTRPGLDSWDYKFKLKKSIPLNIELRIPVSLQREDIPFVFDDVVLPPVQGRIAKKEGVGPRGDMVKTADNVSLRIQSVQLFRGTANRMEIGFYVKKTNEANPNLLVGTGFDTAEVMDDLGNTLTPLDLNYTYSRKMGYAKLQLPLPNPDAERLSSLKVSLPVHVPVEGEHVSFRITSDGLENATRRKGPVVLKHIVKTQSVFILYWEVDKIPDMPFDMLVSSLYDEESKPIQLRSVSMDTDDQGRMRWRSSYLLDKSEPVRFDVLYSKKGYQDRIFFDFTDIGLPKPQAAVPEEAKQTF